MFPEPLLPRNPNVSPARTSKDRSRMTVVSPKSIRKSLMCCPDRRCDVPERWKREGDP